MAYKQEPCPLCGRNMTAIETYPGRGELYCGHCDLTIGGNDAKTPEELIVLMDNSEHRRLKAENKKLRRELDFYKAQVEPVDEDNRWLRERWKETLAENAKLRDAMYTNAGKHALQHMDEDELRIWATQQSEYIEELRELCTDLFDRLRDKDEHCGECRSQCEHDAWNFGDPKCVYAKRMHELGVEVSYRWQS